MGAQHLHGAPPHGIPAGTRKQRRLGTVARSVDSYGLVLGLIFLDYIAASALDDDPWGRVITSFLLGTTLLVALHTSSAGRGLMLLGALFLVIDTLSAVIGALLPVGAKFGLLGPVIGGLLLVIAAVVIIRRIVAHRIVTARTVLGAIDVYLLIGIIFALIFAGLDALGPAPFFVGVPHATSNDYLFFSYSTLTTVGYGNLVPAGSLGSTLAMVEALFGQIYLVIVVARLVSLWGQERPRLEARRPSEPES
ncbi:MAG: potassium channel family protein [Ktedonobacterales bacterium]